MTISIQISGNIQANNQAYLSFLHTLAHLGILTTHSVREEPSAYRATKNIWQGYGEEVAFYESIARSPFHIIYNDAEINDRVGSQILYAILKNRPIIMTGTPIFSQQLHPFISEVIVNHFHDFHSINLPQLDLSELQELFGKLKRTNYRLTRSEEVLMRAQIRAHFRALLIEYPPTQL